MSCAFHFWRHCWYDHIHHSLKPKIPSISFGHCYTQLVPETFASICLCWSTFMKKLYLLSEETVSSVHLHGCETEEGTSVCELSCPWSSRVIICHRTSTKPLWRIKVLLLREGRPITSIEAMSHLPKHALQLLHTVTFLLFFQEFAMRKSNQHFKSNIILGQESHKRPKLGTRKTPKSKQDNLL